MVISIYDSADCSLLLAALGGALCVRGLISSSIAALPRASGWNTDVCTCSAFFGLRTTGHERAREKVATKTERRANRWLSSARRAVWRGGVINVRCCGVVYQFIEKYYARGLCIFLWL